MRKILKTVGFALLLLSLLSACSASFKAPAELIEKPKLSVKNKMAREAIERELPKNTKLVRPLKPGNIKSVGYIDIDFDGTEEAYAFYKSKEEPKIGLIILRYADEAWQVIGETEISGEDIAYADFVDFNSDGTMDLLFSSSTKEGVYGLINAYLWERGEYENIWSGEFNELLIEDISGNENKEIFCIKHDRGIYSSISAYKYIDKSFQLIDEIEMDMYINGYYNVCAGNLTADEKAIFLDYSIGSKSASNLITLKGDKLRALLPLFSGEKTKIGLKNANVYSKDLDGDGIFEIASNYDLAYSKFAENAKKGVYRWDAYRKESDDFAPVALSYVDKKNYYEYIFPEAWRLQAESDRILTVSSAEGHKRDYVSFYYLDRNLEAFHLLSFEVMNEEKYESFLKESAKDYYEVESIIKRGENRIIAYYNEDLAPENGEDAAIYGELMAANRDLLSRIRFLK